MQDKHCKSKNIDVVLIYLKGIPKSEIERLYLCYDQPDKITHLGIGLLESYLENQGYTVETIDAVFFDIDNDEIASRIIDANALCVGFSLNLYNVKGSVEIIHEIRKRGYKGHITAGGQFVSVYYDEIYKRYSVFDSFIVGEGEVPLANLLSALRGGRSWTETKSIVYWDGSRLIRTPSGRYELDIDKLPRMRRYDLESNTGKRAITQPIEIGRGCYGACTFCISNRFAAQFNAPKIRRKSIINIFNEVEELYQKYSCRTFWFVCDNFFPSNNYLISERYIEEFVSEIIKRKLEIYYSITCRADDVRFEWFKELKDTGLRRVFIGPESVNPEELRLYNKNLAYSQIIECEKILKRLEIEHEYGYIFFQPFSNITLLRNHLDFINSVGHKYFPYPLYRLKLHRTTPIYESVCRDELFEAQEDIEDIYHQYRFKIPAIEEIYAILSRLYADMCGLACNVSSKWGGGFQMLRKAKTFMDIEVYSFAKRVLDALSRKDGERFIHYLILFSRKKHFFNFLAKLYFYFLIGNSLKKFSGLL